MRQPQNAKRGRGRGRRGNGNNHHNHVPNRNTSYESNGPDVKLRGNAQQLHEKYMALAHDAASAGERISAEAYTQFADHYFRLHQAAVGVAETKRQQDLAAAAVTADASSGEAASGDLHLVRLQPAPYRQITMVRPNQRWAIAMIVSRRSQRVDGAGQMANQLIRLIMQIQHQNHLVHPCHQHSLPRPFRIKP